MPRGNTKMGDRREALHKIAIHHNTDGSIPDDQLVVIPKDKALANNKSWIIFYTTNMVATPPKFNV